jgi:hypothetical protein
VKGGRSLQRHVRPAVSRPNFATRAYSYLSFVDVGTFMAQKFNHFLSSEGGRPVEERLADVVHVVDGGGPVLDGLYQGVRVLAPERSTRGVPTFVPRDSAFFCLT